VDVPHRVGHVRLYGHVVDRVVWACCLGMAALVTAVLLVSAGRWRELAIGTALGLALGSVALVCRRRLRQMSTAPPPPAGSHVVHPLWLAPRPVLMALAFALVTQTDTAWGLSACHSLFVLFAWQSAIEAIRTSRAQPPGDLWVGSRSTFGPSNDYRLEADAVATDDLGRRSRSRAGEQLRQL